jgi:hypothetical protein
MHIAVRFSERFIQNNIPISLYGVNGKLLDVLFKGRVQSSSLMLSLTTGNQRRGVFIVKVFQNRKNLYSSTLVIGE